MPRFVTRPNAKLRVARAMHRAAVRAVAAACEQQRGPRRPTAPDLGSQRSARAEEAGCWITTRDDRRGAADCCLCPAVHAPLGSRRWWPRERARRRVKGVAPASTHTSALDSHVLVRLNGIPLRACSVDSASG